MVNLGYQYTPYTKKNKQHGHDDHHTEPDLHVCLGIQKMIPDQATLVRGASSTTISSRGPSTTLLRAVTLKHNTTRLRIARQANSTVTTTSTTSVLTCMFFFVSNL